MKETTYQLKLLCTNCDYTYDYTIVKSTPYTRVRCKNCGCGELTKVRGIKL